MATKKITYTCDKCGVSCDTEQEALDCESSHLIPTILKSNHYEMLEQYPNIITIEFENGTTKTYTLNSVN